MVTIESIEGVATLAVTPQNGVSVDNPSTRGILVDVG